MKFHRKLYLAEYKEKLLIHKILKNKIISIARLMRAN